MQSLMALESFFKSLITCCMSKMIIDFFKAIGIDYR